MVGWDIGRVAVARAVVDVLRPGIGDGASEPLGNTRAVTYLQRVIDAAAGGLPFRDRTVTGIGTDGVGHNAGDEATGNRIVDVDGSHEPQSARAHVGDIQQVPLPEFALYAEAPLVNGGRF